MGMPEETNMSHNSVVNQLKILIKEERKITSEILRHLRTVEAQKIFATLGYSSLFEFCTKELGYSEGAAQRRISAMRLVKSLPEAEEKIVSGAISLSVASQVQSFLRKKKSLSKPLNRQQEIDLLEKLEGASSRDSEKLLIELEPELVSKDKERLVTPEHLEIKITVDKNFMENLETLKNLLSHQMPFASTKDILAYAVKDLVKRKDPGNWAGKKLTVDSKMDESHSIHKDKNLTVKKNVVAQSHLPPTSAIQTAQTLLSMPTADVKLSTVVLTGQACNSKKFLEIDHIQPKSRGGTNSIENLQLLCDTHNRLKGNNYPN